MTETTIFVQNTFSVLAENKPMAVAQATNSLIEYVATVYFRPGDMTPRLERITNIPVITQYKAKNAWYVTIGGEFAITEKETNMSRNRRPTPRQRQDATRYLTGLQQAIRDPERIPAVIQNCDTNSIIYKRYGLRTHFIVLKLFLQENMFTAANSYIEIMKQVLV